MSSAAQALGLGASALRSAKLLDTQRLAARQAVLNQVLHHLDDAIGTVNDAVVRLQQSDVNYVAVAERLRVALEPVLIYARRLGDPRVEQLIEAALAYLDSIKAAANVPANLAVLGVGAVPRVGYRRPAVRVRPRRQGVGWAPLLPAFVGGGSPTTAMGPLPYGPMMATSPQAVSAAATIRQRTVGASVQQLLPLLRNARLLVARQLQPVAGLGLFGAPPGFYTFGRLILTGLLGVHGWRRSGGKVSGALLWGVGGVLSEVLGLGLLGLAAHQGFGAPRKP